MPASSLQAPSSRQRSGSFTSSTLNYKLRKTSNSKLYVSWIILCALLVYIIAKERQHRGFNTLDTCELHAASDKVALPVTSSSSDNAANISNAKSNALETSAQTTQAKIGWVTMLWGDSNDRPSMQRAVQSQERYAAKHQYPFFLLDHNLYNYIWSKPAMLLSVILNERLKPESSQLKWIVWTDADSIVMNPEIPIEKIVPDAGLGLEDVHIITTSDIFGLNAGAMMYRVSEYSIDILARSIAYPGMNPTTHLNAAEQSALEKIILQTSNVQSHVVRMPQRYFNGYRPGMLEGQVSIPGSLMMHFPGDNKKYMKEYLDQVEGDHSSWSIPYQQTEYPLAIDQFWKDIKQRKDSGLPLYTPLMRN